MFVVLIFTCIVLVDGRWMTGMAAVNEEEYAVPADHHLLSQLPTDFDTRIAFPGCIHRVLDQGKCGSCWAFAATETLSDRFCIATNGKTNTTLSPGDLLACEKLNLGCTMGSEPEWAWKYLQATGVKTEDCVPYLSGEGHTQKCTKSTCSNNGYNPTIYKAANYTHLGGGDTGAARVAAIQKALLHGPADATFNVYADFDTAAGHGAVYVGHHGGYKGLHSVKIVGWGVQNNTAYWTVQNSWGPMWGTEGGFFKIERGTNNCGFETQVFAGEPALPAPPCTWGTFNPEC